MTKEEYTQRLHSIPIGWFATLIPGIIWIIVFIIYSPFQNIEGYSLDKAGSTWFYSLYTKPDYRLTDIYGDVIHYDKITIMNTVPLILCIIIIVLDILFFLSPIIILTIKYLKTKEA